MRWQPRRFGAALWPTATGLGWLAFGWSGGWLLAVIACLPGVLLIAAGGGQLLWAGDRQLGYHMALAGLISSALALLLWFWLGLIAGLLLIAGGVGSFLVAGWALRIQHPVPAVLLPPVTSIKLVAKIATDAALLGFFIQLAYIPRGATVAADRAELAALERLTRERGWDDAPADYHGAPAAPADARIQPASAAGLAFEWLTFTSRYDPDAEVPGASRWAGHVANRQVGARVLRHPGSPRPWLLCIHGYRMGLARMDCQLFDVTRLHHKLGLNVIMPILPLHGVRRIARLTGGRFLDGPLVDLLHAQAQSLCDLRSCLAWIRVDEPAATIGALGYSLGGYNAALLAAFEPDLACVIAGIPLTDIPATLWQHLPAAHARYLEANGLTPARINACLGPISPLQMAAKVPYERRFLFAATADQLVAPEQPLALWQHWGQPPMHWYDGSHVSVRHEVDVGPFVDRAMAECGLIDVESVRCSGCVQKTGPRINANKRK